MSPETIDAILKILRTPLEEYKYLFVKGQDQYGNEVEKTLPMSKMEEGAKLEEKAETDDPN